MSKPYKEYMRNCEDVLAFIQNAMKYIWIIYPVNSGQYKICYGKCHEIQFKTEIYNTI